MKAWKKGAVEGNENIKEWVIGFVVAVGIGAVYRFSIEFLGPFYDFVQKIFGSKLDIIVIVGLPGFISFALFHLYYKNIRKALVVGIISIVFFLIIFILTLKEIPGVP